MTETVELRNKPELKINLNSDGFEIVDVSDPKNTGKYLFEDLKNVKLNPERMDWLVSIFSLIVGVFTSSAIEGNFKNKANLKLEMVNQNLKIWLVDADFQKAERLVHKLTEKKTYTQQHL